MQKENKLGITALVFCGGEGSRMQPISSLIRKEMLPIGPQRMPLLATIVDHLKTYGIKDIVFMGGSKDNDYDVENFFGDGRRFGVNTRYFTDPPKCHGTGHALLWAIRKLNLQSRNLLIYYGDMYNTINLKELLDSHYMKNVAATIVGSDRYVIPKGVFSISQNGMVLKFEEKPRWHGTDKISVGLLCLNVERFLKVFKRLPSKLEELEKSKYRDIMRDIIGDLVNEREVAYYLTDEFWQDIGSFQDYRIVHKILTQKMKNARTENQKQQPRAGMSPSVFLSYQISKENQAIVEDILSPILRAIRYRVESGAKLNRKAHVVGSPSDRARELISTCDKFVAIATPVGKDSKPSTYVIDEVTYAETVKKREDVYLFVEKNTAVPGHWKERFTYTEFDILKPAVLMRDIVELIERID